MKPTSNRTVFYVLWVSAFLGVAALAFTAGYFVRLHAGRVKAETEIQRALSERAVPEKEVEYTCSMHPQIRQPGPGKCPICQMDLIPVEADTGVSQREYVLSESAKNLSEIEVAEVERKYVAAEVRLVGKVDYDERLLGHITAYFPGRLERLFVDYTGIPVQKGDHMVTIYSPELLSTQEELLQAIKAAKQLEDSDIRELRGAAERTVEAVREKLRLWGLTVEQVEEIEKRGKPSDRVTLYSPMGGIVIHKNAVEGMYVNTGTRIYTIADLKKVWVKLDAYESDLQWIRLGQKVTFTTEAYPGEPFEGKIAFIDPVVNPTTRTIKVRVNVPNEDGKLKPEMFVRAVVRSEVAIGGKVMDPDLAGKWMCPMHPEIVESGAGTCEICEMPLVRTEELGYVAPTEEEAAKPLVIPATAALLTGKRAIVYVQLPKADQPTYEGREIVLGPRAGDYYIVRSGLEEGELVVTRGAFKIDSALQLLAKPSMMIPEGGGGASAHHHGEHADHEMTGGEAAPGQLDVPQAFLIQLREVVKAHDDIAVALKSDDIDELRSAFEKLEKALADVDAGLLPADASAMWKELSMLLKNDAVEGRYAESLKAAKRILEGLDRHMERVRMSFGLAKETAVTRFEVPGEFGGQLGKVVDAYLNIQAALASDNMDAASTATSAMKDALAEVDMGLLGHDAHMAWMDELERLRKPLDEMERAPDIKALRKSFFPLSDAMSAVVRRFGSGREQPLYRIRCPMAFDNLGATWLQTDKDVRNPYFGAGMLKCGDVIEEIPAVEPTHTREHQHE
jgi:Cu(I)/Ag(I) efflux system membrane fusion protein